MTLARGLLLVLAAIPAGCGAGPAVPDATRPPGEGARVSDTVAGAKAAEAAGDRVAAEGKWAEVLAARPEHGVARYALARLAWARGDAAAALDRLRALVESEPQAARGHLLAAEILADPASGSRRDLAAAEVSAREGLRRNPEDSGPHLVLGRVLLLAGRRVEAAERLDVAARMNPRDAESRSLLGVLHLGSGREREATAGFHAALRASAAPGAAATAAGIPGEGDTRETLSAGRTLGSGELRAAAGLAATGVVVPGAGDGGTAPADVLDAAGAALLARRTGEAVLDLDGDGRPDGAAVVAPGGSLGLVVVERGAPTVFRVDRWLPGAAGVGTGPGEPARRR